MPEGKVPNELKTAVDGQHLVMERSFLAPRKVVFRMFSESEHLEMWWGPKGWETKNYSFQFEPGGVWHYCMVCRDQSQGEYYGQSSWGKGTFHDIIVPEKIVYTDQFSDEAGNVLEDFPEMEVKLNFVEEDENTHLLMISRFDSADDLKMVMDMGVVEGVASQFDRLDDYLRTIM